MNDSSFSVDFLPLVLVVIISILFFYGWQWRKTFPQPHLGFSSLKDFEIKKSSSQSYIVNMPEKLLLIALFLFFLAFIDPRFLFLKDPKALSSAHTPTEGIAIYFVLDRSGSMSQKIEVPGQRFQEIRKMDLLKQVTSQFIKGDAQQGLHGRPNDMIGLIAFARGAQILSPLTLDHQAILKQLEQFDSVKDTAQDGTAIGYALFKAANLIAATKHYAQELSAKGEPAYSIKSNVIILVTDGLQDPNPLDKEKRLRNIDIPEAAEFIKQQGIRLYTIVLEPKLSTDTFEPYRNLMERVTSLTGGKLYMMDNASQLKHIYRSIDQLEKSKLPEETKAIEKDKRPDLYQRFSLSPYLLMGALLLFLAGIILETTFLRKAP